MNTFTYLTSFLSPPPARTPPGSPPTASSSSSSTTSIPTINETFSPSDSEEPALTTTTTIDTDSDSISTPSSSSSKPVPGVITEEGETIYLSARRDPNNSDRIRYSLSTTSPKTVVDLGAAAAAASSRRRAEEIPLPDSPILDVDEDEGERSSEAGGGVGWPDVVDDARRRDRTEAELLEDEEGEKRLREKELRRSEKGKGKAMESTQQHHHERDQSLWGILGTLSPFNAARLVYVLLRHMIVLIGNVPYPKLPGRIEPPQPSDSSTTTTTTTTTSIDEDGSSTTSSAPPSPTRSFFRRSSAPPSPSPVPSPAILAPPPKAPPRLTPKTLVLDLDETLIHSTSRPRNYGKNSGKGLKVRVVEVVLEGRSTVYTVYKRPWVDFFLKKVSTWYTVIIFTASLPEYADPVIDWLDGGDGGGGMVGGRLFRSDCRHANGAYVKDLSVVDQDLSRVCLVDNSPASYAINQANGIPIEGWINDPNDECLLDLLPMLDSLRFTSDVRRVLGLRGFGEKRRGQ